MQIHNAKKKHPWGAVFSISKNHFLFCRNMNYKFWNTIKKFVRCTLVSEYTEKKMEMNE